MIELVKCTLARYRCDCNWQAVFKLNYHVYKTFPSSLGPPGSMVMNFLVLAFWRTRTVELHLCLFGCIVPCTPRPSHFFAFFFSRNGIFRALRLSY